ncbi:hypothetical protein [Chlorobium phaeovibrioides]|uniref:hypothetical protein n=1 Tax=Chlorobium phaeovibrioides TaxID=1094 RepID=UPI0012306B38|nr:hypothetical protein [Chlorobium phaeovibrioides]QEQ56966.1 hypothetical protein FNV82_04690 [Chlorobium phaeovibrioides]
MNKNNTRERPATDSLPITDEKDKKNIPASGNQQGRGLKDKTKQKKRRHKAKQEHAHTQP